MINLSINYLILGQPTNFISTQEVDVVDEVEKEGKELLEVKGLLVRMLQVCFQEVTEDRVVQEAMVD